MFLNSVRVIDFTMLLPGPYASLRLADLGAEVIKVEPPGGDPARSSGKALSGQGVVFLANNRHKQSLVLDLKTASGREVARNLVATADVVLEGFRPGVADRLGIGYDTVQKVNPHVIYCSLTGYGQDGPMSQRAGHDLNFLAASGLLSQLQDMTGNPIVPHVQLADLIGGMVASEAVLAALFRRETTHHGEHLDISLTDAVMGLLNTHALVEQVNGSEDGMEELNGNLLCYNLYQTAEGRTVALGALEPKFWRAFCEAVGRPEWVSQQMAPASVENPVYLEVASFFRAHDLEWWSEFAASVDCCLQPVLHIGEVMNGTLARDRHVVAEVETSAWGRIRQVHTHAGGHRGDTNWARLGEPPELGSMPIQNTRTPQ